SGRILIRDAYSYEILYAVHPSQMTDEIDLSSYVDLTSTSIKIEIHGYAKFNSIKVYTPNLFIHNLLLDKAADEFGTEILGNPLNEEGLNPVFNGYSKFFEFSPGTYHAENFQTSEYFIPYMEEINLDGMFSRSYYEEEECHNDTIVITIQVVERYGKSYEIHTIYENSEYLDGRATSIRISLAQFIGKDISFIVKLRVSTTRFESNFFPKLYCSYLGITAKSNAKVNSRAIEAYDYASKDMFTQITPAMVNNQEKLVLARDRQGPIATYRAFIGSETDTILCSGYDLSEYLDISSGHDGWKAGSGGNGLVADVETDYESLIMLNNEQPTLTSGFLDVSLNLNSYGIAAGIVFRYSSSSNFWAIAVQRNRKGDDLAILIRNGGIYDSIPLISKLSSDVSIKIERNSWLGYYQFIINEQHVFNKVITDYYGYLGFYYRIVDRSSGFYSEPVSFRTLQFHTIGELEITRLYMRVQNPMNRTATLQVKELITTANNYIEERLISTIEIPHTEGFETIIADCLSPKCSSRFIIESKDDTLVYLSDFGFLGYTRFGETVSASLYYDINQNIISEHRVKEQEVIFHHNSEWISYDMELEEYNLFYVHANSTRNDNLKLKVAIREINSEDVFTNIDDIYFIEKDGKGYSHHLYLNLTEFNLTPGIFEVKIKVDSTVSSSNPVSIWSFTAKSISDKLMGSDYSDIDQSIEGWRETWDIDERDHVYLNQKEWYTDVAFSALNGGPAESWVGTNATTAENSFYTTLQLDNQGIIERFLGNSIDTLDFPFIEMKIRSDNTTVCNNIDFGLHTQSHGEILTSVNITEYWQWYRFNLYQMSVNRYSSLFPNNDPSVLENLLFDKIFFNFSGIIDITAIKIYSISGWKYVPSETDTFLSTAHLESSQSSVFKLDENSSLAYTATINATSWKDEIYGYWTYDLEFMLPNTQEKTILLSLSNITESYVFDLYVQNN
ncbi:MAG: hypothetical protein KAU62_07610, partial [Candidatus Heimdallarchaeota archaeon]|nr:hypothetical protein [Candidatus Heimdallarchaeota archaeon]MCK4611007.1 hypothetical protein [Candidatus Heimdallarchaeota archaeon]